MVKKVPLNRGYNPTQIQREYSHLEAYIPKRRGTFKLFLNFYFPFPRSWRVKIRGEKENITCKRGKL